MQLTQVCPPSPQLAKRVEGLGFRVRCVRSCRCGGTEFNANGQLFFQPLLQAMRIMIHFGETVPDNLGPAYHLSAGLLALWAVTIFALMLATFGIGAATGTLNPKP